MSTQSAIATSKKITITLPSVNLAALSKKVTQFLSELFSNVYNPLSSNISNASQEATSRVRRVRFPQMNKFKFNKNIFKIIIPVVILIVVVSAVVNLVRSLPSAKSAPETASSTVAAPDAITTVSLDKKFSFPLKDEKGKEVGTFDYVIQSADLQKQIIVQGQRASAINNRIFLILNLKITNNLEQTIQLNTRDYIRLSVSSTPEEQLALDIHNDPVEVQAVSTKYTRVGIALDEEDARKLIQLKVGEIGGDKTNIDLNFNF